MEFTEYWYGITDEGLVRITPVGGEQHPFEDLPSGDFDPTAEDELAATLAATIGEEVSPY